MDVTGSVDALLREAARLLGTGSPPTVAIPAPPSPAPPHPDWAGPASDQARQVSTQLAGQRDQLHGAHVKAANLINGAATITTEARTQLAAVQLDWERDKAAVGPYSNTPAGRAALAAAGQTRVQEATGVISDAANRFSQAAGGVRAAGYDLPMKFGPGDLPLTPTTTTSPEPPQCKPEDQAKLIKKLNDLLAERDKLAAESAAWNKKYENGHAFNANNPAEVAEYARGQELQRRQGQLRLDLGLLMKDMATCGAKPDEATGDILWPDGSRTTFRPPN